MRMRIFIFGLAILLAGALATNSQQVMDRIVAHIEDDILTLSDVQELGRFQELANSSDGARAASEDELIAMLIDQWIINTEATASRFPQPTSAEVQQGVERLSGRFGSAEAYRARLRELGLTEQSVMRHAARQIYLSRYLDYKLRPLTRVENAQVEQYYRDELAPEMRKRGQEAPPLESVDGQIRELLAQREISARAAKWLEETRARLRIEITGKKKAP
jgi:hypothetical protein